MGKGSSTKEAGVRKELTSTGNTTGGGSRKKNQDDSCLFTFTVDIHITSNLSSVKSGDSIVLTLGANGNSIDIFFSKNFSSQYTGPHKNKIISCMKKHYKYEGAIASLRQEAGNTIASCSIGGIV